MENRDITRRWWNLATRTYELVTSSAVLDELAKGTSDLVRWRLALLEGLTTYEPEDDARQTVEIYIRHRIMPANPVGDALHLAIASHTACDLLVTWNYRHLANHTKLDRIRKLNDQLGLCVPLIVSPADLLEALDGQARD